MNDVPMGLLLPTRPPRSERWKRLGLTFSVGLMGLVAIVVLRPVFEPQTFMVWALLAGLCGWMTLRTTQSPQPTSEMHLQTVLQNMPVLLSVYNAERKRVVWNAEAERVTGYSAAEVIDNPNIYYQMYPDPVLRESIRQFRASHNGEYRNWVLPTTCKDGSVRYISWSSVARQVPVEGWDDWAIGTDITERVLAEKRTLGFQEITAALAGATTPEAIATIIVDKVAAMFGAYHVTVYALTPESKALHLLGISDHPAADYVRQNPTIPLTTPIALTDSVRWKKAIWLSNLDEYTAAYPQIDLNLIRQAGFQALAALPLIAYDRVIGGIGMTLVDEHIFTAEEKALFASLAQQAAQALDRAYAYQAESSARYEAERNAERIARLQAVTERLSNARTADDVGRAVVTSGFDVLDMDAGAIFLLTPDGRELELIYAYEFGSDVTARYTRVSMDWPMSVVDVVKDNRILAYENAEVYSAAYPALADTIRETHTEAALILPMPLHGQVIGGFVLSCYHEQTFGEDDLEFAHVLAQQAAQAIDRARAYEAAHRAQRAAEQRAERIASLQTVTAQLSGAHTVAEVAQIVIQYGYTALHITGGAVTVLVDGDVALKIVYQHGYPEEIVRSFEHVPLTAKTPATDAIRQREAIWLHTSADYEQAYPEMFAQTHPRTGTQTLVALPLVVQARVVGELGLTWTTPQQFSTEDRSFILALAQQAAQAIDRARAYEAEFAARRDIEQYAERLSRLQAATAALNAVLTPREVAEVILRESLKALGGIAGSVLLVEDGHFVVLAVQGIPDQVADHWQRFAIDLPTPLGDAVRQGEGLWLETEAAIRAYAIAAEALQDGRKTWINLPLTLGDRLIGGLSVHLDEFRAVEMEERALMLVFAQQCAQAIERALLTAAAARDAERRERQRLARDLHDAVSQTLFSASMLAESIPRMWERRPDHARKLLDDLVLLNRGSLAEMRTLLIELRPEVIITTRLDRLIGQLVDSMRGRQKLNADLQLRLTDPQLLPEDVQVAFYRIAQEALTNVVKHANGSRVIIALRMSPNFVILRVWDNGQGFNMERRDSGIGLRSMRERAEDIGAEMRLYSRPKRGTCITVLWSPE